MVERVARRSKNVGERFLGCRAYPQCRGTRPIAEATTGSTAPAPATDPEPQPPRRRGVAGGSARQRYEKLDSAHREHIQSVRGRIIAIGAAGVVLGLVWLTSDRTLSVFQPVFGGYLAILSVIWVLGQLFITPHSIRAWRTGADGEAKTAAALERLGDDWIVLHDRRIPGSRANIDHIAIGPPGIFVIETKDYSGRISLRGNEIRVNGRRVGWIDQVRGQAQAVIAVVSTVDDAPHVPVTPIICVHRADLPWLRSSAAGVRVLSGRGPRHGGTDALARRGPSSRRRT
jgi:nuclease-like protein